jgi:hypothetical protein
MSQKRNGSPDQEGAKHKNARNEYARSSVLSNAKKRITRSELMQLHDEVVYLYHHSSADLYTTRLIVQAIMRKKKTYAAKAKELRELIEKAKREGAR